LTGGPMASLARFSPSWTLPVTCLDFLGVVLEGCFFYLFPNGRFVPRWMGWIFILLVVQQITSFFLPPNSPLNSMNWPAWLSIFFTLILFVTVAFSQIYRYVRVSTPTERQQTKWVCFG